MVRSAQTVHLSCVKISTISNTDRLELPLDPHHLEVLLGAFKIISEPMVRLAYTVHLSCTNTNTISKRTKNEIQLEPRHQWVPSGVSKTISEPMVHSVQTVHLSCVKISTISKRTKTVRPKWFLILCYIGRKLCTYLTSTLTLFPNGLKWDSTWPTSPRGSNGCVQKDLWAYGMYGANRAPVLH
jgi:hypothetical protein